MLRQASLAVVLLMLCITLVAAESIKGRVTKVDDKSVTLVVGKAPAKAYDLAKDCKFYREGKAGKEEIKDGAKADIFKNIPDKGLGATITTDQNNKVTEVTLTGKKKKGAQ